MIGYTRGIIRLPPVILAFLFYFAVTFLFYPLLRRRPYQMRTLLTKMISLITRFLCRVMGITVFVEGDLDFLKSKENFLLVSNHLSYLDILAISSRYPVLFVTSQDMREIPFLGHICELAGCLFVERRNRHQLSREIDNLAESLRYGHRVLIFPEATSSDGQTVLRFKRPLFKAAAKASGRILPLTINYQTTSRQSLNYHQGDQAFWYGKMTFLDHFWGVLCLKGLSIQLTFSPPLSPNDFTDNNALVEKAYQSVHSHYVPIPRP